MRNNARRRERQADLNEVDKIRQREVKRLCNEFRSSHPASVRGLFCSDTDKFYARVVYWRDGLEIEENLEMTEAWIANYYTQEMVEFLKQRRDMVTDTNYLIIPKEKRIQLKTAIQRIKYIPKETRIEVDHEKQKKREEEREEQERTTRHILQGLRKDWIDNVLVNSNARREMEELERRANKEREDFMNEDKPTREIYQKARFMAMMEGGKMAIEVSEEEVRNTFGDGFTKELMHSPGRLIDVAVGDYKESRLHLFPNLLLSNAPRVHYNQTEGQDLCAFKSLASVVHYLGWVEAANRIDDTGIREASTCLDSWKLLYDVTVTYLPKWIQVAKINRRDVDWIHGLEEGSIVVTTLYASNGHVNHAVAIHENLIFDANEKRAMPLSQEALDYCVSTSDKPCTCIGFFKTYLIRYIGNKQAKKKFMRGPMAIK